MGKIKRTFQLIFNHPLSKKHISRSLARLFWWQFQCTLFPTRLFIKSFIKNIRFYSRKGLTGVTGNIYTGLHEFAEMTFLLHFLRPEDTFLDVGANVGSYTLLASGVCGSKTIAVEPIGTTFDILSKNATLNHLDSLVSTANVAAGAAKGALFFTSNNGSTNHVLADDEPKTNTISVPVITIDSLLAGNRPALIKIDVEGYETAVLKGMTETLDQPSLKVIIIELNGSGGRYGFDEDKIHDLMIGKGFTPYTYDPYKRQLSGILHRGDLNTIYCRDSSFIVDRLKTAEAIEIMGELI